MMETLFGSTTQLWSPLASSGFAFPSAAPAPNAIVHGPFFAPSPAAGTIAPGQSQASMIAAPIAPPAQAYGYSLAPVPIPGEAALGGSIPLLLGTVAMRRGQGRLPSTD